MKMSDENELLRTLYHVLYQACVEDEETMKADGKALSNYEDGLLLLERYGLFKRDESAGRVCGWFKELNEDA